MSNIKGREGGGGGGGRKTLIVRGAQMSKGKHVPSYRESNILYTEC